MFEELEQAYAFMQKKPQASFQELKDHMWSDLLPYKEQVRGSVLLAYTSANNITFHAFVTVHEAELLGSVAEAVALPDGSAILSSELLQEFDELGMVLFCKRYPHSHVINIKPVVQRARERADHAHCLIQWMVKGTCVRTDVVCRRWWSTMFMQNPQLKGTSLRVRDVARPWSMESLTSLMRQKKKPQTKLDMDAVAKVVCDRLSMGTESAETPQNV